ncbi:MAG: DNA polymerase III subunit delta', partial [Bacteroidota bacterium]
MLAQSRVRNVLDRMLSSNRVAHALLFHGPHGAGKRAAALAFAGALQAGSSSLDAGTGDETYGRVQRMLHPDVHVFFPYPRDTSETDIAERLGLLGANPYAEIDYVRRPSLADPMKTSNKQAFYPVKRINDELKRVMSFRPHEGRYKVAILIGADTLRVEAANAFLKLLEEPAPNTVFILTTSRPDRILPTILSRCQRVRFDALAPEVIEHALVQQRQLDPVQAAPIARMAAGSYTRAVELASNPRLIEQRAAVVEFFRVVFAFDGGKLADFVEQQGKAGRE